MEMKAYITAVSIAAFMISAAANVGQYFVQKRTDFLLQIETKRNEINLDQINEMLVNRGKGSAFGDPSMDTQFAENQGYLRGIQSVVHRVSPQESEVSSIWHAGYQRGMEQTDFVGELQYEKGYSNGFQAGQRDNMKAINTILKSGNDFQGALKNLADELQQKIEKEQIPSKQPQKPSK